MGLAGTSATRTLVAPSAEVRSVNVRSGRPFEGSDDRDRHVPYATGQPCSGILQGLSDQWGEIMDEYELKRAADVGLAQREADKRTVERMQAIAFRLFGIAIVAGLCGWLLEKL